VSEGQTTVREMMRPAPRGANAGGGKHRERANALAIEPPAWERSNWR
jgi:hypothetical protein